MPGEHRTCERPGRSPSDPGFKIGSPGMELSKVLSFLGVGVGAWIDLATAIEKGLVPGNPPSVVIHLLLVCIFAIFVVACFACFACFAVASKNRPRRYRFRVRQNWDLLMQRRRVSVSGGRYAGGFSITLDVSEP